MSVCAGALHPKGRSVSVGESLYRWRHPIIGGKLARVGDPKICTCLNIAHACAAMECL